MPPRKAGAIPAKADPDKQERFIKEEFEPRLNEAESGKRVVFFVDAAHFVLAHFLGILWSFTRLFIEAPAGRKRFNVLGALNAITHELIPVTNDTCINAQSFCDLLWRISRLDIRVPITLVLDNARYQKCKLVWELAESLSGTSGASSGQIEAPGEDLVPELTGKSMRTLEMMGVGELLEETVEVDFKL